MPHLGPPELIIILIIVLLVFGAGKLASVGGALGGAVRDFRNALNEGSEDEKEEPKAGTAKTEVRPASASSEENAPIEGHKDEGAQA